ncbi:MAG: dihydrofolate reductase [Candidatus Saccharibacteria bacterium]|nr:dihydrofolate reductase [Candidatus Saccharibacteria bacterium]
MSLTIIAAVGKRLELGKRGGLCFDLPGDLKFFKKITMHKPLLMGYRTWQSLPRKLPGRTHYVLSPKPVKLPKEIILVQDLKKLTKEWRERNEEMFVIGGGMVFRQMIELVDRMYLTEVEAEDTEADTFFPNFNQQDWTRKVVGQGQDGNYYYKHVLYLRKELKDE